jgi:hypothetical protein
MTSCRECSPYSGDGSSGGPAGGRLNARAVEDPRCACRAPAQLRVFSGRLSTTT